MSKKLGLISKEEKEAQHEKGKYCKDSYWRADGILTLREIQGHAWEAGDIIIFRFWKAHSGYSIKNEPAISRSPL